MSNKTSRILVVDDDRATRDVFSQLLSTSGYAVQTAATGREALEVTQAAHPEIVLLDVRLPDISGLEVCRRIKLNPALPDVFVVLISGQAISTADKVGGLDTGADDYLPKPVDFREFLARLRTIVRLREATAALRASEQHYRRLLEIMPNAVNLIDLEGRVTEANPQAAAMLGFSHPEALVGKSILELFSAEDRARFGKNMEAALRSGRMSRSEFTMLRRDGRRFPAELSAAVLTDAGGKPAGLVVVGGDATARKRAEEDLRQLSRRIIEAQEAERLRVARELHDGVNQTLASAKMRLCKVKEMLADSHPADSLLLERCQELLLQALEENRYIAHNLHPTILDDLGLAEACRSFCEEVESRAGIRVECRIAGLERRLESNVELNLFRIIQEALGNVVKHARARSATLDMAIRDGHLVLRVEDDGQGFKPERGSAARRKDGSGIGLANMRERAALLGGTCEVRSTPGQGTVLTTSVPLPMQRAAPQAAPVSTQQTA